MVERLRPRGLDADLTAAHENRCALAAHRDIEACPQHGHGGIPCDDPERPRGIGGYIEQRFPRQQIDLAFAGREGKPDRAVGSEPNGAAIVELQCLELRRARQIVSLQAQRQRRHKDHQQAGSNGDRSRHRTPSAEHTLQGSRPS